MAYIEVVNTYRKLKELTMDELKALYGSNTGFSAAVDDDILEIQLQVQEEEYNNIFGKHNKYVNIEEHYSTFYLTCNDMEKVLDTISSDSLSLHAFSEYNIARMCYKRYISAQENEAVSEEHVDIFYNEFETAVKDMLRAIEEQLKEYEEIKDGEIDAWLEMIQEGYHHMSEWHEHDGVVYEEIVKEYK